MAPAAPPAPQPAAPKLFASKAFAQWRLIGAVFAGLLALLIAGYLLFLRQDYSTLYGELSPADAAAIVAQLDRQHVPYKLADGGARILVPAAQVDAARLEIAAADISPNGVEGFELFDQSDMGLTDFAQKIKYQRALQGELTRTIMMMDGVAAARVHISVPERSLFRADQRAARAAVTLITRSAAAEAPERIEGIRRLVAASVTDLALSDVVILNERGEVLGARPEILTAAPAQAVSASTAEDLLGGADGAGQSLPSVLSVVGPALPHRRVEISIETAPSATGPIRTIVVSTDAALSEDDAARVRTALREAQLIEGSSGAVAAFRVGLAPLVAPPPQSPLALPAAAPRLGAAAPQPTRPPEPSLGLWLAITALAILGLGALSALVVMARAKRAQASLSSDESLRFAERLRVQLRAQQQETHNEPA